MTFLTFFLMGRKLLFWKCQGKEEGPQYDRNKGKSKNITLKSSLKNVHIRYLDPDLQLEKMMDPDPHYINADPQPCFQNSMKDYFEWSLQGKTFIWKWSLGGISILNFAGTCFNNKKFSWGCSLSLKGQ